MSKINDVMYFSRNSGRFYKQFVDFTIRMRKGESGMWVATTWRALDENTYQCLISKIEKLEGLLKDATLRAEGERK